MDQDCLVPSSDAQMVRLYRDAGGIIFCKTNVPQVGPVFWQLLSSLVVFGTRWEGLANGRPFYRSNALIRSGELLPIPTTPREHAVVVQVGKL